MKQLSSLVLVVLTSLVGSGQIQAQVGEPSSAVPPASRWVDDLQYGVMNALVAGVGAGVVRLARGGSFTEAFARGSLGGGLQYLGRRAAAANYDGAGVVGRSVHALGASASRSAARGLPAFQQLLIPAGPLWLEWDRGENKLDARLDAQSTFWLAYAISQERLTLDVARSLSAGTFIFLADDVLAPFVLGTELGGIVALSSHLNADQMAEAFAHERVHVLQRDASFALLSEPADDFLASYAGDWGSRVTRRIHFGVSDLLWDPLFHDTREAEALFLGRRY